MAIYKFRDKWRAELNVKGRRLATRTFNRKLEAEVWLAEQKSAHNGCREDIVVGATLEDAVKRFESFHLPTLSKSSQARYQTEIDRRIRPYFRYTRLDRITQTAIESFKSDLGRCLKPKAANLVLSLLQNILGKAVKYGLVASVPKVAPFRLSKRDYQWWDNREHIERFLAVARSQRYYLAFLVALETGLRPAEILALSADDVDLARGTIRVWRQWHEVRQEYDDLKDRDPRTVTFNPGGELARVLAETISQRPTGPLVVTRTGMHQRKTELHTILQSLCKKADVPRISFRGLRHTFASWYMRQHDDVWALMALMGHADTRTTMIYAHHSRSRLLKPLGLDGIPHKSHTLRVVGGATSRKN